MLEQDTLILAFSLFFLVHLINQEEKPLQYQPLF